MTLLKSTLIKYKNDIFIETGTALGDGVDIALSCGFKQVYSIEIDPPWFKKCQDKFKDNPVVSLYHGDSFVELPKILEQIRGQATFWLDAHYMDISTVCGKHRCPILYEIDTILEHSNRFNLWHTILIDDRRLFTGTGIQYWNSVNEKQILSKFSDKYLIEYDFGVQENDVIVVRKKD
jgi:hypothetical protein